VKIVKPVINVIQEEMVLKCCCAVHLQYSTLLSDFVLCFITVLAKYWSRDRSAGTALGYGLDDRGSRVRFLAGAGNFSPHHRVQNGSGAHPASYPMGTRVSFPEGKAAGS
jgi:hypothetical protein